MNAQVKLFLRRFTLRWLRKLVDVLDDRLHAAEVKLREEIAATTVRTEPLIDKGAFVEGSASVPYDTPKTFIEWEARRSGVAPVSKKSARARRERTTATGFDLRFAR
jgi:hypothetical protein